MDNIYFLEMPADYRELADSYHRQFAPDGPIEKSLIDTMVYDIWLRNRSLEFLSSYSYDPAQPSLNDLLDLARQRLPLLERHYAKTLSRLRRIQKRRTGVPSPAKLASFVQNEPRTPRPPALPKTATGEWVN
jgi:hypothetical protein